MRFPFVWRKSAEDEAAVWKAQANEQRRRAVRAERQLAAEVFDRRRIAALYADLVDECEASHGPLLTAPPSKSFTAERARQTAARLATARARRARMYLTPAPTAEEATP